MRALIIDDHPLYRAGVRALLAGLQPDLITVDVANVAEALQHANLPDGFDLVLLDMNLPGINRLEALKQIKAAFETASVVVVSGEEEPSLMLATIEAGAAGFIPKSTNPEITMHALRLVLAHGTYLPVNALRDYAEPAMHRGSEGNLATQLSERQRAVLLHMLQGKANKVIARELDIAEGTVKAHLWSVYQMLGVTSRSQAMCRVHALGLLEKLGKPAGIVRKQ
jgi:DNA-binding NarL/FixJ family response regulator